MKKCVRCGETRFLTKHHVYPKGEMKDNDELHYTNHLKITLCRECHEKEHGIVYTKKMLERRVKRAKRRINKANTDLEFAQYMLFKLKQKAIFVVR